MNMANAVSPSAGIVARPVGSCYLYNGDLRDLDQDEYYAVPPTTFYGWLRLPLELRDRIRAFATHDDAASHECILDSNHRVPPILQVDFETRSWSRRHYFKSSRFEFWVNDDTDYAPEATDETWETDPVRIEAQLLDSRKLLQSFVENVLPGGGRMIQELIVKIGSGIFSKRPGTSFAGVPVDTITLWREVLCTIKDSRCQPQNITWKLSDLVLVRDNEGIFWKSGAEVVYFSDVVQELDVRVSVLDDDTGVSMGVGMWTYIRTDGLKLLFPDNDDDPQDAQQDPCKQYTKQIQAQANLLDQLIGRYLPLVASIIGSNTNVSEMHVARLQEFVGVQHDGTRLHEHAARLGLNVQYAGLLDAALDKLYRSCLTGDSSNSVLTALNQIVTCCLQTTRNLLLCVLHLLEYLLLFRLQLQLLCNGTILGSVSELEGRILEVQSKISSVTGQPFDVPVACSPYLHDIIDWANGLEIDNVEEKVDPSAQAEDIEYTEQESDVDTEDSTDESDAESEESLEEDVQPVGQAGFQRRDLGAVREALRDLESDNDLSSDAEGDSDEGNEDDREDGSEVDDYSDEEDGPAEVDLRDIDIPSRSLTTRPYMMLGEDGNGENEDANRLREAVLRHTKFTDETFDSDEDDGDDGEDGAEEKSAAHNVHEAVLRHIKFTDESFDSDEEDQGDQEEGDEENADEDEPTEVDLRGITVSPRSSAADTGGVYDASWGGINVEEELDEEL